MSVLRELWHSWRTSPRILASRRHVLREQPALHGRDLYVHVIAQLSGLDLEAADELLERANESCCCWPVDRKMRLRDLASYVTVVDCMKAHPARGGMRADITRLIAHLIPETV